MMEAVERGEAGGILLWEVSRFCRRPMDMEKLIALAETGGIVIDGPGGRYDLTTKDGRRDARTATTAAAYESDTISARSRAGLARKMRAGKPMGGGRTYGFEVGGQVYRPAEVKIIREVAKRMLRGESIRSITLDLAARGEVTSRGTPFREPNLLRMILRPRNAGKIVDVDGNEVGVITDPTGKVLKPILDADTYGQLLALAHSRKRGRPQSGKYLLTGIARCSGCGRTMAGTQVWRKGVAYRTYRCRAVTNAKGVTDGCSRQIRADDVDAIVTDHVLALLAEPDTLAGIPERRAELSNARAHLFAEVEKLEASRAALEVRHVTRPMPERAYNEAADALEKMLAAARATLDNAGNKRTPLDAVDLTADWQEWNDTQRRAAITGLVTVTIDEARHLGPTGFQPERVVIANRT
jgi:hypothetical protein